MKKILFFVIAALLSAGKMSAQVKVVGNITTNGTADTYPTHLDNLGYGGYRVVADITERNAISSQRRKYGMLVYVQADDKIYVLRDMGLGNANWVDLSAQLIPTSLGLLSNLSVSGIIEGGTFSGTLSSTAQNTITSLGNLQAITVVNGVSAANLAVSGSVNAGTVNATNISGLLVTAAQPNITSVGQLTNLSVSGMIEGGSFSGTLESSALNSITSLGNVQNLTVVNSISAAQLNVSGTVSSGILSGTSIHGTLNTAAQPNITSVGQLGNLSVSGMMEGGTFSGTLASSALNSITNLGNVQNLTVANSISAASVSVSGTVTAATVSTTTVQATRFLANANNVTAATSVTVDFNQGNIISLPLTTSITTLTFANAPVGPASYVLKISYASATANTIAWPASIKWSGGTAPTLTCATGKTDIISLIWDGTAYYGTYALNF